VFEHQCRHSQTDQLASGGFADREHVALGGPELDDVGAVVLRAVDHE
jgi:hypothetical protein